MSEYLSDDDVKRLGLDAPEPKAEYLSDNEVAKLGLDAPEPEFVDRVFTKDNAKRAANAVIRAQSVMLGPLGLAAPQFDVAPAEATGSGGAFGRGVQQGASLGFSDEEAGVRGALNEALYRGGPVSKAELVKQYVLKRQAERGADERARATDAGAFLAGEVAGGMAVPVPGGAAKALSAGGKFARGAKVGTGTGAALGLGMSEADLTKGEVGRAAFDTALGGGLGAAGGVVGEGVGMVAGGISDAVRGRAQRGIREAVDAETAIQQAAKDKGIRSATGALGGESAAGIKTLERLEQASADPDLPAELRQAAAERLASPEMRALKEKALSNYVEKAPEQMGRIQSAEGALAEARGVNVGEATAEALEDPWKKHVRQRFVTLGNRYLPLVAGSIGYALGGPEGAAIGGALGTAQSLTQGAPGRIIKNLIEKPAVRKAFWEKVLAGTKSPDAARLVPALEDAAAKGDQRFAATVYVLGQRSEAGRELMQRLADATKGEPEDEMARAP